MNNIQDLNQMLFDRIKAIEDDSLTDEQLEKEIKKCETVTKIANVIIQNANLALQAQKQFDEYGTFKHKYGVKSGTHGGRFLKGQPALNKGKKMSPEQYKKCSGTMFRKGHRPQNHREVGSERINVDGYIEIKVEEPNKWRLKQRVMYEKYHNVKLTRDEAIVFLDGNKLNLSEDNLYCLTRAELARYNQNRIRGEDSETGLSAALLAKLSTRLRRSIKGE